MDPGHVLAAAGERPADAEPERGEDGAEEAIVGVEDVAGADDDEPDAGRLDLAGRLFPLAHDLGVVALSRIRGLVDDRVAAVPVEPDRRLVGEDRGLLLETGDRADQVVGGGPAALQDSLFGLLGPALVDLLADQIDDRVDTVEGLRRRAFEHRLPAMPDDRRVGAPRPARVAGEADHGVAPCQQ